MQAPMLYQGKVDISREDFYITPNFKTTEFRGSGTQTIYYDYVQVLQHFRDALEQPISIDSHNGGSLSFRLSNGESRYNRTRCEAIAASMLQDGYITDYDVSGDERQPNVTITIDRKRPLSLDAVFENAFAVTASYETSSDPYTQVTGNFDGAILSFGALQWNVGTGSLRTLFDAFEAVSRGKLYEFFGGRIEYDMFRGVIDNTARSKSMQKNYFLRPKSKSPNDRIVRTLRRVGEYEPFREVQRKLAFDHYGTKALRDLQFVEEKTGHDTSNSLLFAGLLDCAVQQGGLGKVRSELSAWYGKYQHDNAWYAVLHALNVRGTAASKRWAADCVSRRQGIMLRRPVETRLFGQKAQRKNPLLHKVFDRPFKR